MEKNLENRVWFPNEILLPIIKRVRSHLRLYHWVSQTRCSTSTQRTRNVTVHSLTVWFFHCPHIVLLRVQTPEDLKPDSVPPETRASVDTHITHGWGRLILKAVWTCLTYSEHSPARWFRLLSTDGRKKRKKHKEIVSGFLF